MSKLTLTGFALLLALLLGNSSGNYAAQSKQKSSDAPTGILQKMIVENGTVTMELHVNRLNGLGSAPQAAVHLQFAAANSFFSILVFNDLLRGPEQGSMALIPQQSIVLPPLLGASIQQLIVEKLPSGERFDLAVRDAKTSFTFFNIEGHEYDYDANAQLLSIHGGRLLISDEFAKVLGRPADQGQDHARRSVPRAARVPPREIPARRATGAGAAGEDRPADGHGQRSQH